MNGAREYYKTISGAKRLEIGYLRELNRDDAWGLGKECYINGNIIYALSDHARGKCFRIFLVEHTHGLTDKELVNSNNRFEVYGVLGGQNGWTEYYGWIHKGNWVQLITDYLDDLKSKIDVHCKKVEEHNKLKELEIVKQIESTKDKFNKMYA